MACFRYTLLLLVALMGQRADTIRSFSGPSMNPAQFMVITSPSQKKIVWTPLKNFQATDARVYALISSGLVEPKGVAFDRFSGFLYVADTGAKKVYRYKLLVDVGGPTPRLIAMGDRLTLVSGHPVEWVTVDDKGNLLYTDPQSNNINKITTDVMEAVDNGHYAPSALQIVSEKKIEAKQIGVKVLKETTPGDVLPTDAPPLRPYIYAIYEAKINPHVSKPAAISAQGNDLFWVNQEDGKSAGTVVKGEVNPRVRLLANHTPAPFPAHSLTKVSNGAYGNVVAGPNLFFTRNGTIPGTGLVTSILLEDPDVMVDIVTSLAAPRGLLWDRENTMYVADEAGGKVWSFPSGRVMSDAPLTLTVEMEGAYGLMVISGADPCFKASMLDSQSLSSGVSVAGPVSEGRAAGLPRSQAGFLAESRASSYRDHAWFSISLIFAAVSTVAVSA